MITNCNTFTDKENAENDQYFTETAILVTIYNIDITLLVPINNLENEKYNLICIIHKICTLLDMLITKPSSCLV